MTTFLVSLANASPPGLVLGLYDFDTGAFEWVDTDDAAAECVGATGICRLGDDYWVLLMLAHGGYSGLARVDPFFRRIELFPLADTRDAHSLVTYDDGFLVADTAHNRINHVSVRGGHAVEREFWRCRQVDADIVHLNSVAVFKGDVCVSLFGDKPADGWASSAAGQIVNVTRGNVLCDRLSHPHTLLATPDALYWLESQRGRVHRLSAEGTHQVVAELDGYARGLAFKDASMYVGISGRRRRSRSTDRLNPAVPEPARHSRICRIDSGASIVAERRLTLFGTEPYDFVPASLEMPLEISDKAAVERVWRHEAQVYVAGARRAAADLTKDTVRRLCATGDYAWAANLARAFAEAEPDAWEWHYLFAYALHMDPSEADLDARRIAARREYTRALELGGDEFWARLNRGLILRELAEFADAEADLVRAVQLRPESPEPALHLRQARRMWIRAEMNQEHFEAALALLHGETGRGLPEAERHALIARCLQQRGDFDGGGSR